MQASKLVTTFPSAVLQGRKTVLIVLDCGARGGYVYVSPLFVAEYDVIIITI